MGRPVFERFRDYLQGIADAFDDNKLASKIFPNSVDIGSTREDIFMAFLKNHIPNRCDVIKGGFIFDSQGKESKQIDLMVTNDLTLNFKNFEGSEAKSFTVIEGCYATFSIKSNLTKETLFDSLDNLASIPPTPKLNLNPLLKTTEKAERLPHRIIFAFDGIDVATIGQYLNDYYKANKVSGNEMVDYIVVNNKSIIQKTGKEGMVLGNNIQAPPFSYFPNSGSYIGAWSLWIILTGIQTLANFGPHILFNFKEYDSNLTKSMF